MMYEKDQSRNYQVPVALWMLAMLTVVQASLWSQILKRSWVCHPSSAQVLIPKRCVMRTRLCDFSSSEYSCGVMSPPDKEKAASLRCKSLGGNDAKRSVHLRNETSSKQCEPLDPHHLHLHRGRKVPFDATVLEIPRASRSVPRKARQSLLPGRTVHNMVNE